MLISIVTEANQIDPGSLILEECFYNQEQKGPYLLASGEENPQGEEVLIIGSRYIVNRKEYDLASGYAIKAVIKNNYIIPVLRRSRMQERQVLKTYVQENPRIKPHLEGELQLYWPVLVKIWAEPIEDKDFINEAIKISKQTTDIDEVINNKEDEEE